MTFGHGARICVGKEYVQQLGFFAKTLPISANFAFVRLALVQMKLVLALVLHKFSVTIDETQSEDEMKGLQMAVLAPKGGRCLLRFSYR